MQSEHAAAAALAYDPAGQSAHDVEPALLDTCPSLQSLHGVAGSWSWSYCPGEHGSHGASRDPPEQETTALKPPAETLWSDVNCTYIDEPVETRPEGISDPVSEFISRSPIGRLLSNTCKKSQSRSRENTLKLS